MCTTPTSFIGLLVATIALLALAVMVIRWVMGKQDKLRWRLLAILMFVAGVVILYVGALL
jgi:uncharacterized membrane protein